MTNEEYLQIKQNILAALDRAIASGDWEASLFFQNIGKRLIELRDQVSSDLEAEEKQFEIKSATKIPATKPGYRKVYISLHQAEGSNLERWYHTIKVLSEYSISRPIYSEEAHIRELIRSKSDVKREGYVVVNVPESAINSPVGGQPLTDKYGNLLLNLKERSVKLENILEFVHMDERYRIVENKLVKMSR